MKNLDLSIVIPTLGRVEEVEAMLNSIISTKEEHKYKIEVIVVDQNFSDLLDPVVNKYQNRSIDIIHKKVPFRGLSKAKNYGACLAHGKFICFVDDDAAFLSGTIKKALNILSQGKFDVVSGKCVDGEGRDSVLNFSNKESVLSLKAFEGKFIESTMFFKREICEHYHYDENMGIGTFYGAEEGYDLVFQLLQDGKKILFNPEILFYHPQTVLDRSLKIAIRRAFTYRAGFGYLCRKHNFRKKYYKRLFTVICYIPYLLIFRPKDVRYYLAELLGLLVGKLI